MKKILLVFIILLFSLFLYGHYIEPYNLKTKEFGISANVPDSFKELKIVQLSDINYKSDTKLDKVLDKINELDADIVFFTGDLFSEDEKYSENDYNYLKEFLKSIKANFYKYAVYGDNDLEHQEYYKDLMYEANFKLLLDESILFFYKDVTPINIVGLNDSNKLNELLTKDTEYECALILMHKPDMISNINNSKVKAVFSGHSLGGLINVPFYGGLFKKEGSSTYIDNYYKVNDIDLFINNGIGYNKFAFRLFNTPSINVFYFDN